MINQTISEQAVNHVKLHAKELIGQFANLKDYPSSTNPQAIFMAGCPGAGKTEFSKGWIEEFNKDEPEAKIVRIDADEVREKIPQYDGTNSTEIQGASALGVQKLFDQVKKHRQSFILDGTFSNLKLATQNIESCIKRDFKTGVFYIYQDPLVAWDFTKKRERLEGRFVPKDFFIESLFSSYENVDKVKEIYKDKVTLYLVIKDIQNKVKKTVFNIERVADYLKIPYNRQSLERAI